MFQRVVCVRSDESQNSRRCGIWLVLSLWCLCFPATASAAFNWWYHMMWVCLSQVVSEVAGFGGVDGCLEGASGSSRTKYP